jgi:PAS domain S-box-containing protein
LRWQGKSVSNPVFGEELSALTRLGGLIIYRMSADWSELIALDGDVFVDQPSNARAWVSQYIPPQSRMALERVISAARQTSSPFTLVHQFYRPDRSVGWVSSQAVPLTNPDGSVREWVGVARDITAEREAKERAERQAARQNFLLALSDEVRELSTPRCVMQLTAERLGLHLACGRVRYVEVDRAQSSFAASAEWANRTLDVQPVADRFSLSLLGPQLLAQALSGKPFKVDDVRSDPRTMDQAELFLNFKVAAGIVVPMVKDQQIVGALSVHHPEPRAWSDEEVALVEELAERTWAAAQRARAEQELLQTQAELRLALEVAGLARWQFDLDTEGLVASAEFKKLFGRPLEEDFTFPMLSALIHPEDRPRCRAALDDAVQAQGAFNIEYRCTIHGEERWIAANGRYEPLDGSSGRLMGVARDVTTRRRTEEEQRLVAERLRLIIDSAKDYGILTADEDGLITSWNQGAERILGFTETEAIGQHLRIFFTPEDVEARRPEMEMQLALSQGRADDERWHVRKDGSTFWASGEMVPVEAEHLRGFVKIFRDLTERRRADERTRLLVDELNHRVKNTLATVQSITKQTLKGADLDHKVQEALLGRFMALAASHDLLTQSHWKSASFDEVVHRALEPFIGKGSENVIIRGAPVTVQPRTAVSLGLALHELATNAVKHGALSRPNGRIEIDWHVSGKTITFTWTERSSTASPESQRKGFGTRLLAQAVPYELGGSTQLRFSSGGMTFMLELPLETNVV